MSVVLSPGGDQSLCEFVRDATRQCVALENPSFTWHGTLDVKSESHYVIGKPESHYVIGIEISIRVVSLEARSGAHV